MRDILYQKSVKLSKIFVMNMIGGAGWALGVTFGFAVLVTAVAGLITAAGGLPVVGDLFTDISKVIEDNITKRP